MKREEVSVVVTRMPDSDRPVGLLVVVTDEIDRHRNVFALDRNQARRIGRMLMAAADDMSPPPRVRTTEDLDPLVEPGKKDTL